MSRHSGRWLLSVDDVQKQVDDMDPDGHSIEILDLSTRLRALVADRSSGARVVFKTDIYSILHRKVGKQLAYELAEEIADSLSAEMSEALTS